MNTRQKEETRILREKKYSKQTKEIYKNPMKNSLEFIGYPKGKQEGKDYNCNIYGDKQTEFRMNKSGFNYPNKKSENPVNLDFDKTVYRPLTSKFDGYAMFPKPLTKPFNNNTKMTAKLKEEMSNMIKGCFNKVIPYNMKINREKNYYNVPVQMTSNNNANTNKIHNTNNFNNNSTLKTNSNQTNIFNPHQNNHNIPNKPTTANNNNQHTTNKKFSKTYSNFNNNILQKKLQERIQSESDNRSLKNIKDRQNKIKSMNKVLNKLINFSQNPYTLFDSNLLEPSKDVKMKYKEVQESISKYKRPLSYYYPGVQSRQKMKLLEQRLTEENMKNINEMYNYSNKNLKDSIDSMHYEKQVEKLSEGFSVTSGETYYSHRVSSAKVKNLYCDREKKLLKGFKIEELKEQPIIHKGSKMIKTEIELFLRNKALLEITNPIACKVKKDREELVMKFLRIKKEKNVVKQ